METVEEFKFKVWGPHLRGGYPSLQGPGNQGKCNPLFPIFCR